MIIIIVYYYLSLLMLIRDKMKVRLEETTHKINTFPSPAAAAMLVSYGKCVLLYTSIVLWPVLIHNFLFPIIDLQQTENTHILSIFETVNNRVKNWAPQQPNEQQQQLAIFSLILSTSITRRSLGLSSFIGLIACRLV